MKLIIAIIQPHRLEAVKQALADVEVFRLTVMDVQGFGRQRVHTEAYRGHEFSVNLLRKVQLMIAVNEEFLEPERSSTCPWKTAFASAPASEAAKPFRVES
jgi:nitrogen regulatory protein P-II 1